VGSRPWDGDRLSPCSSSGIASARAPVHKRMCQNPLSDLSAYFADSESHFCSSLADWHTPAAWPLLPVTGRYVRRSLRWAGQRSVAAAPRYRAVRPQVPEMGWAAQLLLAQRPGADATSSSHNTNASTVQRGIKRQVTVAQ